MKRLKEWIKTHRKFAIVILAEIIIIAALVTWLIVLGVTKGASPNSGSGSAGVNDYDPEHPNGITHDIADKETLSSIFKDLDIASEEINYLTVETALDDILSAFNIYEGCGGAGASVSGACVADRINQLAADYGIEEANHVLMLELEKAMIYIKSKDPESAWSILGAINAEELLPNIKPMYFDTMCRYFELTGDEGKYQEYLDLLMTVVIQELG